MVEENFSLGSSGSGKPRILWGVTGSIAAYKMVPVFRQLKKEGYAIQVVLTRGGRRFVPPDTLHTLVGRVWQSLWERLPSGVPLHVVLAQWLDWLVVAPCTAHMIAQFAGGHAPSLLTSVFLATDPLRVVVVPAMEEEMYLHPATQANLDRLASWGVTVCTPVRGLLASGKEGLGRVLEPEDLLAWLKGVLDSGEALKGRHFLVTAGRTYEPIDPIRYLTNRSSGKMGWYVARELVRRGARVTYLTGPDAPSFVHSRVRHIRCETTRELVDVVRTVFLEVDGLFSVAALADFEPVRVAAHKLKKRSLPSSFALELGRAPNLLEAVSGLKRSGQVVVAFVLETDVAPEESVGKLDGLGVDLVVYNRHSVEEPVMGTESTRLFVYEQRSRKKLFAHAERVPKWRAARDVVDVVVDWMRGSSLL